MQPASVTDQGFCSRPPRQASGPQVAAAAHAFIEPRTAAT